MLQNSYQTCEFLSGALLSLLLCILCWNPTPNSHRDQGDLHVAYESTVAGGVFCVWLCEHSVVLGTWYSEGKRKRKKSMAFEAGTIYVLFIYSKLFIWCHSQNEKLWLRASYIDRDTFWWDEKRLFSQGRKIKRNLWLNFRDFLHRKNRSITFSSR